MDGTVGEVAAAVGKVIDAGERIADRADAQHDALDAAAAAVSAPLAPPAPSIDLNQLTVIYDAERGAVGKGAPFHLVSAGMLVRNPDGSERLGVTRLLLSFLGEENLPHIEELTELVLDENGRCILDNGKVKTVTYRRTATSGEDR